MVSQLLSKAVHSLIIPQVAGCGCDLERRTSLAGRLQSVSNHVSIFRFVLGLISEC